MNKIVINDVFPDCEKEIIFNCNDSTKLFIGNEKKFANIDIGEHKIKILRHHDFFLDWYVDEELIEEFLVWQLVSNQESIISINSSKEIMLNKDNKNINNYEITNEYLPFESSFNQNKCVFSINCIKPSQLSMFFQTEDKKEQLNFKTITLAFENTFCKVFLDTYQEGKYQKDLRENLSLFHIILNEDNLFFINKIEQKMTIQNKIINLKNYLFNDTINNDHYSLLIRETYTPNGHGNYIIKKA